MKLSLINQAVLATRNLDVWHGCPNANDKQPAEVQ